MDNSLPSSIDTNSDSALVTSSTRVKILYEQRTWNAVFAKELAATNNKEFSSYWWKDYYKSIQKYFRESLPKNQKIKLLEAGCGSGKASFIVAEKNWELTLVDISENALLYAKQLSIKWGHPNAQLIEGDIFDLPVADHSFDFVWNIGVIEHYDCTEIKQIIASMIRKAKPGGVLAVGYPNFWSGPTLKAWLLKYRPFSLFPGYKLDTESFFSNREMFCLMRSVMRDSNIKGKVSFVTVGNPLPMEVPGWALRLIGPSISKVFPKNRFLTFLVCHVDDV